MSTQTQAGWETPASRRIASAHPQDDTLIVHFEDGACAQVNRTHVLRPDAQGVRWEDVTWTPFEVIVPTAGDPVEIPWSTLRALTDADYRAHLAAAAEVDAQQMGLRLRDLRRQRGLTGKEVAARVGIAPQSLSRIEHGRHDVALSTVQRLLGAMDYTLADLVAPPPGSR